MISSESYTTKTDSRNGEVNLSKKENITEVAGWTVIYPSECNGAIRDLGFVYPNSGYRNSHFVHFNDKGEPYGTYMPNKVRARLIAMRNREFNTTRKD